MENGNEEEKFENDSKDTKVKTWEKIKSYFRYAAT
jgi:hypothetical protein